MVKYTRWLILVNQNKAFLLLLLLLLCSFQSSHTSVSWWFLIGVWMTVCLLKSSEPFLGIWPILIMMLFRWSPLILFFPSPSDPLTVFRTPITTGISVTFMFHTFFSSLARSRYYLSLHFLSFLHCGQFEWQSPLFSRISFFCCLSLGLVIWPRLVDPFRPQNLREVCVSHHHHHYCYY